VLSAWILPMMIAGIICAHRYGRRSAHAFLAYSFAVFPGEQSPQASGVVPDLGRQHPLDTTPISPVVHRCEKPRRGGSM